jgi:hypothetical protein
MARDRDQGVIPTSASSHDKRSETVNYDCSLTIRASEAMSLHPRMTPMCSDRSRRQSRCIQQTFKGTARIVHLLPLLLSALDATQKLLRSIDYFFKG